LHVSSRICFAKFTQGNVVSLQQVGLLLPRDAMYKYGLCGLMRCPSVRLSVTFVYYVETNDRIFILSLSGSHTILVFSYHTLWQNSYGVPLTGASNAGGVGRNRDYWPISGFGRL